MKKFPLYTLLACAALALATPVINAAEGDDAPAQPPPRRARGNNGGPGGPGAARPGMPQLSPEERQKLNAAVTKAREEAEVKKAREAFLAAQKKYNETLKAAVVKEDPSLKEVVEKFKDAPLPFGNFNGRRAPAAGSERPAGDAPRRGNRAARRPASADNV